MIYIKLQTNRHTLKKFISEFTDNKLPEESLVAPRPLPKHRQVHYIALVSLVENSKNHARSLKFSKFTFLTEEEWRSLIDEIQFSWKA